MHSSAVFVAQSLLNLRRAHQRGELRSIRTDAVGGLTSLPPSVGADDDESILEKIENALPGFQFGKELGTPSAPDPTVPTTPVVPQHSKAVNYLEYGAITAVLVAVIFHKKLGF